MIRFNPLWMILQVGGEIIEILDDDCYALKAWDCNIQHLDGGSSFQGSED